MILSCVWAPPEDEDEELGDAPLTLQAESRGDVDGILGNSLQISSKSFGWTVQAIAVVPEMSHSRRCGHV